MALADGAESVFGRRMNRPEFITYIAEKSGMTEDEAERAVQAVTSGILDVVLGGGTVVLRGFGRFYLSVHRGHPTRFLPDGGGVPDYVVFRFTPSHALHKNMRTFVQTSDLCDGSEDMV